jgi:tetratricopeptide (TPR) repeat protein
MSKGYWIRNWTKYLIGLAVASVIAAVFFVLTLGCDGKKTAPPDRGGEMEILVKEDIAFLDDDVEKRFHNGVKLYNVCEYADAKLLLEDYVSRRAEYARPMAYLILGEIERAQTNHCGSISLYEWALQRGSPYVRHHAGVNLVYACLRCDRVDRAEEVAKALMVDGEARFRKSDIGANKDIELCRAIVYRRRGHDCANEGNWVIAADNYHAALKLRPDFVDVACDFAWAMLRSSQGRWKGTQGRLYDSCMVELVIAYDTLNHPRYARFGEGRCADLRVEVADEILRQWGIVTGQRKKAYKDTRHAHIAKEIVGE